MENKETFAKKVDNFFYHYKLHLTLGIIAALIVGFFLYSVIENKMAERKLASEPTSLSILMFGDYKIGNQEPLLEETLKNAFPEWDKIQLLIEYVPTETYSFEDIAEMQRSIAILHTEKPDIYIYDKVEYDKFIDAGLYIPLDDHFTDESVLVKAQKKGDDKAYVYGIDITDSKFFSDLEISPIDKIAVINDITEREENAIEFIKKALEE